MAGVVAFDPQAVSPAWAQEVADKLDQATRAGVAATQAALPPDTACQLLGALEQLLKREPTLVEVTPTEDTASVTVVGDTHGQFHDVLEMLRRAGPPSASAHFVFNGDFVDRGAWGLETLALLAAWKLALPGRVTLLRGNHESLTCTWCYGFKAELAAKYGAERAKAVYKCCKRVFASLPLAAVIASNTLVLHGGLFRKPPPTVGRKHKRKRSRPRMLAAPGGGALLGSLADLAAASKGGVDPSGEGSSLVAADVMWSDPVPEAGLRPNDSRGVGVVFGPDVTARFLSDNGLRLVLRSHEGPDARSGRDDMPHMQDGYSLDHDTPSGQLWTVFSAPDYPQFQMPGAPRFNNTAAVAVLCPPEFATPEWLQFTAVPRPEAQCFYDLDVPDSDEEIELGAIAASDCEPSARSGGSALTGASGASLPPGSPSASVGNAPPAPRVAASLPDAGAPAAGSSGSAGAAEDGGQAEACSSPHANAPSAAQQAEAQPARRRPTRQDLATTTSPAAASPPTHEHGATEPDAASARTALAVAHNAQPLAAPAAMDTDDTPAGAQAANSLQAVGMPRLASPPRTDSAASLPASCLADIVNQPQAALPCRSSAALGKAAQEADKPLADIAL